MRLSAAQPCGHGFAQPTQLHNSLHRNAWKNMFLSTEKWFFQDISFKVLSFYQKKKANVHFLPELYNYPILSSFPLTFLGI